MSDQSKKSIPLPRVIRVFVSSTFRDMHSERDHLVKVVFPQLRERLERHRIHLVDVDLRWGITREQAENDRALDLCLDFIEDCRPFFIGILGERYGWVPKQFPEAVLREYGWIQHHTGKSITALEIIHGVLRDPGMRMQSFFYFRDPSFLADVPESILLQVKEEDPDCARKLLELKGEIKQAELAAPPMKDYPCRYAGLRFAWRLARQELSKSDQKALEEVASDGIVDPAEYQTLDQKYQKIAQEYGAVHLTGLEEFGKRVRDDLWEGICRQFPELKKPPVPEEVEAEKKPPTTEEFLAEERDYHERFIESRTQMYVGRDTIHHDLLEYIESDENVPLVVSGPSGSGKSAILGRLYNELERKEDLSFVLGHFVGASPQSTNLRPMLRRFCLALRERFNLTETREEEGREPQVVPREVPEEVEKLSPTFREFLEVVPENEKVVFVIDALNQLDEAHRAHELNWLPRKLPPNVKFVVSCIEGEEKGDHILEILRKRECRGRKVEPLTFEGRSEIVTKIPSLSARTLDPEQIGLLLSNPATENPLFLLVALEELRGFGSFELLNTRIKAFPRKGDTVTAIFDQVLERLEEEFNTEVVREMLPLIATSRHGLSETELQELLQEIDPGNELFVILRQLRPYLLKRGELVDFYHQNLEMAVRQRYLAYEETEKSYNVKLAEYLKSKGNESPRTLSELPHHQTHGEMWDELVGTLCDLHFIEAKCAAVMVYDLIGDYNAALASLPEFREEAERERHRVERCRRYGEELIKYALDPEANPLPDPPPSVAGRGEGEIPEKRSERAGRLRHFANFVYTNTSFLAEEPAYTPELAANYADESPVAKSGRRRLEALSRPCLLRSPRPPTPPFRPQCLRTLEGHSDSVTSVSITPDGIRAFSGSQDNTLKIWDLESGECLRVLEGHGDWVLSVSVTPDGKRAVSGSVDRTLRVWDLESGNCLRTMEGHNGWVLSVSVTPDGKRAVSASSDRTLRIWDLKSGQCLAVYHAFSDVRTVAISPAGDRIICGTADGQMHFLTPVNFPPSGPAIITVSRFIEAPGTDRFRHQARCPYCAEYFEPGKAVIGAINFNLENLSKSKPGENSSPCLDLPDEAFNDPRLLADCPHCGKQLKLNPFFVDMGD